MDEKLQRNLSDGGTWRRLVFMLLFAVIFSIAELVVCAVAVVQFLSRLFAGSVNDELRALGDRLGRYLYQIVAFETFQTEDRPYPFAPFPAGDGNQTGNAASQTG
jgi:hypothetical protein|tara:strand:+ start:1024 stop:1338 length:315 start_codon:yes stop_codon:yes gene_type:complete